MKHLIKSNVKVKELKMELFKFRIDNSMGRLKDFNQLKSKRKELARVITELRQKKES